MRPPQDIIYVHVTSSSNRRMPNRGFVLLDAAADRFGAEVRASTPRHAALRAVSRYGYDHVVLLELETGKLHIFQGAMHTLPDGEGCSAHADKFKLRRRAQVSKCGTCHTVRRTVQLTEPADLFAALQAYRNFTGV